MALDWLWIAVFGFGGLSMGMITTFVGLPKGRELWAWLTLYAFMITVVIYIDIQMPFWTVLFGSIGSGLSAATVQSLFMQSYGRNNPWYEPELDKPALKVAASLYLFAIMAGSIFGAVVGGIAWAITVF